MIKKILVLSTFFCLVFSSSVKAQVGDVSPTTIDPSQAFELIKNDPNTVSYNYQGNILVDSVKTDKTSYNPGEIVTGSITFKSSMNRDMPDVYFKISVDSGYTKASLLPEKRWATSDQIGPVSLNVGEVKTIPFSYVLPLQVRGGEFGITINAETASGLGLGWNSSMITVSGVASQILINDTGLVVNGDEFSSGEGPTLLPDDDAVLNVYVTNTGKIQTLNPVISLTKWGTKNSQSQLFNDFPKVTFEANKDKTVAIDLPKNLATGVYQGSVSFVDSTGKVQSSEGFLRYIIGGDVATVQGITADMDSFSKGDTININVDWTGQPFDIVRGDRPPLVGALLDVTLKNESGIVVGYSEVLLASTSPQIIPIISSSSAQKIDAIARITKDGEVLSSYDVVLGKTNGEKQSNNFPFVWLIIFVVFILLIILGASLLFMKNKIKFAILLIIVAVCSLFGLYIFKTSYEAKAQALGISNLTYTNHFVAGGSHDSGGNNIFISVNGPATNVSQGTPIYFSGSYSARECYNSAAYVHLYTSLDGGPTLDSYLSARNKSDKHKYFQTGNNFAPLINSGNLAPGIHNIGFALYDYQTRNWVAVSGNYTFEVIAPAVTVTPVTTTSSSTTPASSTTPVTPTCNSNFICKDTHTINDLGHCKADIICGSPLTCSAGTCVNPAGQTIDPLTQNADGTTKGNVLISTLKIGPNTINPYDLNNPTTTGICNVQWALSQYDSNSVCTITGGHLSGSSFSPTGLSGVTKDTQITSETTYKLTCGENVTDANGNVSLTSTSTKRATCNVNASFNEVNR